MARKEWFAWVVAVTAGSIPLLGSGQEPDRTPLPELVLVQVPASGVAASQDQDRRFPTSGRYLDGTRIIRLNPATGAVSVLTSEFAAACDPDVSFDGRTILFAGKRDSASSWQIWRMNVDGSGKTQVTRGPGRHLAPIHAGSRFYLDDPEPTPQIIFVGDEDGSSFLSLYGTDHEGRTLHRITFHPSNDVSPALLPTGRIVFGSSRPAGDPGIPGADDRSGNVVWEAQAPTSLLSVNLDGTDLMPFHGNHGPPLYRDMPGLSLEGDRVFFVESVDPSWLGGGNLASVSWRRPLSSYQGANGDSAGPGVYHSPLPLGDGGLLASYRHRTPDSLFALYRVDPETGRRVEKILEKPGWHSIDAQIVGPRPSVKGRSNWLRPGSTTGVFYCLDCYRTSLDEDGDGLVAPRGTIKHVRVIEGPSRRILGVAPVEADGSFHVRVPSETPIAFQLLDEDFLAIRSQWEWIWVMGNENRGCVGCHEDRELSPPNRMPQAIPKPPVELTLPPARRRSVDFRHQVGPLVGTTCATAGCHVPGGPRPTLGPVDADAEESDLREVYQSLLGDPERSSLGSTPGLPFVVPGSARSSPLIHQLLEASGEQDPSAIPHRDLLPRHDLIRLIEWVDLGAVWNWNRDNHGSSS